MKVEKKVSPITIILETKEEQKMMYQISRLCDTVPDMLVQENWGSFKRKDIVKFLGELLVALE